jgi:sRNA-binding regulator protein Hfq
MTTHSARPDDTRVHRKFVAKGHDAQLQEAQMNNFQVVVNLMYSETSIRGVIARRDKWTITVTPKEGASYIIYKHAIESVQIIRPVPRLASVEAAEAA